MTLGRQGEQGEAELEAIRRLILRDLASVYRGAYSAVYEDAAQHAIEVVLRRGRASFDDDGFPGYCVVTARHYVGREYRRHGVRRAEIEAAEQDDGARGFDSELEVRELLGRVRGLRPAQRTALTGLLLGLSYAQIQAATGRSYTWVNKHMVKGRAALRAAA